MSQATEHITPSRRSFLAAVPAAALASPVAAVPALAAVTAGAHPDAALLALWTEHERLRVECEVGWAEADAALDRYRAARPPIPDVLLERPSDRTMGLPEAGRDRYTGAQSYSTGAIWVRDALDRDKLSGPARVRAEEIMTAYEAWEAENKAALRAADLDRDEEGDDEEEQTTLTAFWDVQERIAETPATTMDGLMVKARAAAFECRREHSPGGRSMPTDFDTAMERAERSHGHAVMALAVVQDLLRIGGEAVSPAT